MAQLILSEETGNEMRDVIRDIEGAVKYLPGDSISKEQATGWATALQKALDSRVKREHHGPRKPRANAGSGGAGA